MILVTDVIASGWLLLIPRIPAEPSRHRVAVWRELRRLGAVTAASGAWALPDLPAYAEAIAAVRAQAEAGGGSLAVLTVTGAAEEDTAMLREVFTAARRDEWAELVADCGKFEAEIEREIVKDKLTFAELEEEEQSMARLRRWQRDLVARNPFPAPEAQEAAGRLDAAAARLARYAELVYRANVPDGQAD